MSLFVMKAFSRIMLLLLYRSLYAYRGYKWLFRLQWSLQVLLMITCWLAPGAQPLLGDPAPWGALLGSSPAASDGPPLWLPGLFLSLVTRRNTSNTDSEENWEVVYISRPSAIANSLGPQGKALEPEAAFCTLLIGMSPSFIGAFGVAGPHS